jgi:hypothetical protein
MKKASDIRTRILSGTAIALASVLTLFTPAAVFPQTADCVAAVVNDRPVTLVDLKIAVRFGFVVALPGAGSLPAALDELVDRKLVIDLARDIVPLEEADVAAAMKELAARMGPEELTKGLGEFGLEESDLKPYIEEGLLYKRIISSRFGQASPVTLSEIEAYYKDVYTPAQKKSGIEPVPMVQALGAIEAEIQEKKNTARIGDWIRNLKAQADIRINRGCLE